MDHECQFGVQETGVKPRTSSVITKETPYMQRLLLLLVNRTSKPNAVGTSL